MFPEHLDKQNSNGIQRRLLIHLSMQGGSQAVADQPEGSAISNGSICKKLPLGGTNETMESNPYTRHRVKLGTP